MTWAYPLEPWAIPGYLEEREGRLHMDGVDLATLAERWGTPLVVYSERRLRHNVETIARAFAAAGLPASLHVAAKACSNRRVLSGLRAMGGGPGGGLRGVGGGLRGVLLGLEVNSGGELHLARAAGFEDERIVFNGVAKAENEIESALSIKAINVDSLFELERILRVAQSTGRRANVALRVIPGLSIGSSPGNETGSNTSKFGLLRDEFETALEIMHANASLADLVGLHIHVGSQVRTASAYRSIADYAFDIIRQFDLRLRHVNLGGGYPVDYVKTAAQGLDPGYFRPSVAASDIATAIASSPLFSKGDLEPIVEPGRAVFGDAAVLLARVIGVKKRDVPWLYLDAGYHQMLEQFSYKWYYHALNASRCNETETGKYRLFGPLCDSGDAFHDVDGEGLLAQLLQEPELRNHESVLRRTLVRLPPYRELPAETREGDLIAFLDTGAYTLETMSANNGHVRPEVLLISAEVLLDSAEVTVESIRRRDTLADL